RTVVGMLGDKKVRMTVSVVTMRSIEVRNSLIQDLEWEHCFAISGMCRLIGQYVAPLMVEDLELTGLLHDLGALVLIANYPREYEKLVKAANLRDMPIVDAEKKLFGVDRNDVLLHMSESMHLPSTTMQTMRMMSAQQVVENIDSTVDTHLAVLTLAHHIDAMVQDEEGVLPIEKVPDSLSALKQKLDLTDENLDQILDEYQDLLNSVLIA
ncbi:MAG: HDOD domain-containing protein, partial [Gammaproteobacteria bacterium]|nr:HDOD domain-containing protein [Gammaproteobacteria bacterium]